MTKPFVETLYCSICGTKIGTRAGRGAVTGLICNDPLCAFTGPPRLDDYRNEWLVNLVRDGLSAVSVAARVGLSRQRIYQIVDGWDSGR